MCPPPGPAPPGTGPDCPYATTDTGVCACVYPHPNLQLLQPRTHTHRPATHSHWTEAPDQAQLIQDKPQVSLAMRGQPVSYLPPLEVETAGRAGGHIPNLLPPLGTLLQERAESHEYPVPLLDSPILSKGPWASFSHF